MPEPLEMWDTSMGPEQGWGAQWGCGQGLASSRHTQRVGEKRMKNCPKAAEGGKWQRKKLQRRSLRWDSGCVFIGYL